MFSKGFKILPVTLFLLVPVISFAQKLSPKAELIYEAYQDIEQQPHAPILQMRFIEVFPASKQDFIDIFNPHTGKELNDVSIEYIKKLRKLGYDYTDSVLLKCIMIGKEIPTWSKGQIDELQKTIYLLADHEKQLFVNIVSEMKKEEQEALATFLSSGENGRNKNYGFIVDLTKLYGTHKLYKVFSTIE